MSRFLMKDRHIIYNSKIMKIYKIFILLAFSTICSSCFDRSAYDNIEVKGGQTIAVPVIDSELSIGKVNDVIKSDNASIKIDSDNKVTVVYNGQVLRNTSKELFPPTPGLLPYELPDTNSTVDLPIDSKYMINKAIFGKTNMSFIFATLNAEPYTVTMTIPEIQTPDGAWTKTYNLSGMLNYITESSPLEGLEVLPDNNKITFIYEAINPRGERVKFQYAAMRVDILEFSYVEGFFNKHVFDIEGQDIEVGLFDAWVSGGMDFSDPKMNINVENSFGFPVRSMMNRLQLQTLGGNTFNLESSYINTGIDFAYPKLNEVGESKFTTFSFDRSNSNIRSLFNEKVVRINYDIDAIANPDVDETIPNFVSDNSFFQVNVNVEVPLLGEAKDFVLQRTVDLGIKELDQIASGQLKFIFENEFPVDVDIWFELLNADGAKTSALFEEDPINIPSPEVGVDGRTIGSAQLTQYKDLDATQMQDLREATQVKILIKLTNPDETKGQQLWIYNNYEVRVKLGLQATLK